MSIEDLSATEKTITLNNTKHLYMNILRRDDNSGYIPCYLVFLSNTKITDETQLTALLNTRFDDGGTEPRINLLYGDYQGGSSRYNVEYLYFNKNYTPARIYGCYRTSATGTKGEYMYGFKYYNKELL